MIYKLLSTRRDGLAFGCAISLALLGVVATTTAQTPAADEATAETSAQPEENSPPQELELARGRLRLLVPGAWDQVKPRSRIVEHEFAIPPAEGDSQSGRMTVMRSGGGVEANIARWKGQFTADANTSVDDAFRQQKAEYDGLQVHTVDLQGTFHDQPRGPFGPKVNYPAYRMLGAIIQTEGAGDYFVKFYGPRATMDEHAEAFQEMIEGLQWSGR